VVPNVYWGLGFSHELDLLSINKASLIGTEIEIKVSKGDLKRDLEKRHQHYDQRIQLLYFAGPADLEDAFLEYVPKEAGIITVCKVGSHYQCTIRRRPRRPKYNSYKFTEKEIRQLLHLGNMRYWKLFQKQFNAKEIGG
jgi:hypothetical protein